MAEYTVDVHVTIDEMHEQMLDEVVDQLDVSKEEFIQGQIDDDNTSRQIEQRIYHRRRKLKEN